MEESALMLPGGLQFGEMCIVTVPANLPVTKGRSPAPWASLGQRKKVYL